MSLSHPTPPHNLPMSKTQCLEAYPVLEARNPPGLSMTPSLGASAGASHCLCVFSSSSSSNNKIQRLGWFAKNKIFKIVSVPLFQSSVRHLIRQPVGWLPAATTPPPVPPGSATGWIPDLLLIVMCPGYSSSTTSPLAPFQPSILLIICPHPG